VLFRSDQQRLPAVPDELHEVVVLCCRIGRDVREHATHVFQRHAFLLVEIVKLVAVPASQVAQLRYLDDEFQPPAYPIGVFHARPNASRRLYPAMWDWIACLTVIAVPSGFMRVVFAALPWAQP